MKFCKRFTYQDKGLYSHLVHIFLYFQESTDSFPSLVLFFISLNLKVCWLIHSCVLTDFTHQKASYIILKEISKTRGHALEKRACISLKHCSITSTTIYQRCFNMFSTLVKARILES